MKLADVEQRLSQVDLAAGQDLIYELLAAYGIPQSSITRLRTGAYDKSGEENTVLWKNKVWDEFLADADDDRLLAALDRAQANTDIGRLKPRFYVAHNDRRLAAIDSRLGQTLDIALDDLSRHAAFFMPWAGAEKTRSETITYIDTKVAKEMAKLYDEVIATNPDLPNTEDSRRDLNIFFSRLLFCFFAEDTGVFDDGIFTDAVSRLTATDGTDTAAFLDQLFAILDTPEDQRSSVPSHFEAFGYVNGSLFSDRLASPTFSRRARNIVVDCGTLDWSSINPDIFGSMIQAVAAGEDRTVLGMHYTSVENILKVLNPLFLNDLEERYEAAEDSVRKLTELLDHLGEIKVFDPACGSGNFLIVAYKRLRALEHRILLRLGEIDSSKAAIFADSRIPLENFYGIEIDDFAHDIAKLSLWFAKHQMNQEYDDLFGIERPLIPLTESGAIACGNSIRLDWTSIAPASSTTFICGNPPYLGSALLDQSHKADFAEYFGQTKYSKELDYVSLWFLKAAEWLEGRASAAFVSTNSACQGQHVALLWPSIIEQGVKINFAHTSFLWSNSAAGGAGVTCIIVGLSKHGNSLRKLYSGSEVRTVANINPYLVASSDNTVVSPTRSALSDRPTMSKGSGPVDGGHLLLDGAARRRLLAESYDEAQEFIHPYVGARELLSAEQRWCLWIEDNAAVTARKIAAVELLLAQVARFRRKSKKSQTRDLALRPHRFIERRHQSAPCIAAPRHSSERREFIPMGYYSAGTVISDANSVIYGAKPWLLGLLQSAMHVAWIRSVGGRLDSRLRYSNTLCYNTFPFPDLDEDRKADLNDSALRLLAARERWPDRSLAKLYDPDKMPANLRAAHEANDVLVDSLYRFRPFTSDADRMELLLEMYRDLVAPHRSLKSGKE